ncbi:MAG: aspartate aminotransferase family protein [Verrucomicrobiae bacterium]|nr:aspartate aminotransferase family protein [Verrucomicrobiae bacterium]
MSTYPLTPKTVPHVQTAYRTIRTQLPVPESLPILEEMRKYEPQSMSGLPPVVWKKGENDLVHDYWGNRWIDWSCGVLITNVGHGRKEIVDAIVTQAQSGLLTNYLFPHALRGKLARLLVERAPKNLDKAFILSTGSETLECAIKLCRTRGMNLSPSKRVIVSFINAFHGRTLGSQMIGGVPGLKAWIGHQDPRMVQVPFPEGFRCKDLSFELFKSSLAKAGVKPADVCGVILESYQGGNASFADVAYIKALREWCDEHSALLVFDEVQAGFGRTGKYWGFEHYGVRADILCCGKGISGSLPLSAVIAHHEVLDLYAPGSMTSTHSCNPVCCAATIANLEVLDREKAVENAARLGETLHASLRTLQKKHASRIGAVHGKGLVAALHMVKAGSEDPDADAAWKIVEACYERGVLMFSPVGFGGASVKIAPPLTIAREALEESLGVLGESLKAVLG